jgi:exodeoxyribonuclease VII small subunit
MSEERTYESAVERLDEVISRLDSGDAQLRETLDLCAEAKTLIEFCAAELSAVDQGLKELKLDELAQSLAPAQGTVEPPAPSESPAPLADTPPSPAEEAPPVGDDEVPF